MMECSPNPDCKYYNGEGCGFNTHHLYWPASEYTTKTERRFRNLGSNTVRICKAEHDELHATQKPPEKPSAEEMELPYFRTEPY